MPIYKKNADSTTAVGLFQPKPAKLCVSLVGFRNKLITLVHINILRINLKI